MIRGFLLLATLLSGAAALTFEVVWVRMLGQVLGQTSHAVSAVLVAYFLGLGLGSLIFSRLVPRFSSPLLVYVGIELAIGVLGLAMPFFIELLEDTLFAGGDPTESLEAGVSFLRRFLSAVPLLLLPTFLMGGTLPLLSQILVRDEEELGDISGLLYAVNTVGAVIGTLAAGFFGIEFLGLEATGQWAAIANGLAAVLAGVCLLVPAEEKSPGGMSDFDVLRGDSRGIWVLGAIGLSGFFALSAEVLWTRLVGLYLTNSSYSFTIILAMVLLGSSVGALCVSRFVDRFRWPGFLLGLTQFGLGCASILSVTLAQAIESRGSLGLEGPIGSRLEQLFGANSYGAALAGEVLGVSAFFCLPTILMGMAFPLAVRLYGGVIVGEDGWAGGGSGPGAGRNVGSVLYANTLIGLFGPPAVTFLLIPLLGVGGALLALGFAQLLLGAGIVVGFSEVGRGARWAVAFVFVFAGALLFVRAPKDLQVWKSGGDAKLLAYRDGSSATVAVVQDAAGRLRLKMNNTYSLGGGEGSLIEARQGHIPVLLAPGPVRQGLVIGMGTGNTARAMSRHPIDSLTVVEIVPGVIELSSYFSPPGEEPLGQDHVNVVARDGREILLRRSETYDLIVGDLFFPWRAGVSDLYSLEHFQRVRERLSARGIFCQWLPLYQLSPRAFAIVVRTYLEVFPDAAVWFAYLNARDPILCLVGGKTAASFDRDGVLVKMRDGGVRPHLSAVGLFEPEDVLALYITRGRDLLAELSEIPDSQGITQDDRPILEYRAARDSVRQQEFGLENLRRLIPLRDFEGLALPRGSEEEDRRMENAYLASGEILKGLAFELEGDLDPRSAVAPAYKQMYEQKMMDSYYRALELAPEYPAVIYILRARIDVAMRDKRFDEAINITYEVLDRIEPSAEMLSRLGISFFLAGDWEEAIEPLEQAIALDETHSFAHFYLGVSRLRGGEVDQAEEALSRARALLGEHPLLFAPLGEIALLRGDAEGGREYLRKALEVNPADDRSRALLAGKKPPDESGSEESSHDHGH